jgi:hypothetical protein
MMIRSTLSVDIHCPNCHQAEQVVVDVLLISNSISVSVPEVSAPSLNSLAFLVP